MAAARAGFTLKGIDEYAVDALPVARYPDVEKYLGWPMLIVLQMQARTSPHNRVPRTNP